MIFPLKDGTEWELTKELYIDFCEEYPLIDVDVELDKMRKWLKFNDTRRKTPRGMKKAINHWLGNDSIEKAKRQRPYGSENKEKERQWTHLYCPWIETATPLEVQGKVDAGTFNDPAFRAWAGSKNELLKGM